MSQISRTSRRTVPQLNIRSEYAVRRARDLARRTGKTATQVVEEALRAYQPEPSGETADLRARRAALQSIIDEAKRYGPYPTMKEFDEETYDEWGLPK